MWTARPSRTAYVALWVALTAVLAQFATPVPVLANDARASAQSITEPRYGSIKHVGGRCLETVDESVADGTVFRLNPCDDDTAQHFTIPGDGTIQVLSKCLDSDGPAYGTTGQARIQLWRCNGQPVNPHQHWELRTDGAIYHAESDRCLTTESDQDRAVVFLAVCNGSASQQWTLPPTGPVRFGSISAVGKCLETIDETAANETPFRLNPCDDDTAQHFTIPGDGTIQVLSKCLDSMGAAYGATGDTRAHLWKCNGQPLNPNQVWEIGVDGAIYHAGINRCLTAESDQDQAVVYMTTCDGRATQRWTIPPLPAVFGRPSAALPATRSTPTSAVQASPVAGASLGALEFAYTNGAGQLFHGHQSHPDDPGSVQWTAIQDRQAFVGQPALAEHADGRLMVVALNRTGAVWARSQQAKNPPVWGPWSNLGGPAVTPPTLVRQLDGRLVIFVVDEAGKLWAVRQYGPNSGFSPWTDLGVDGLTGAVTAAPVSDGIRVFGRAGDGTLRTVLYRNGTVDEPAALGDGPVATAPAVVTFPGELLRIVARRADGVVVTMMQDAAGQFPAAWDVVPGSTAAGAPAAVFAPNGRTEIMALGSDGVVYGTRETSAGSGAWTNWGARTPTSPTDPIATDPTLLTYVGTSGQSLAFIVRNADDQSFLYK